MNMRTYIVTGERGCWTVVEAASGRVCSIWRYKRNADKRCRRMNRAH
jgi:hypothetical protein